MDGLGRVLATNEVSGLVLAETIYDPNVREPLHEHECAHFCLALDGECVEFYRNQSQVYRRFTTGFFPAGHAHAAEVREAGYRCFSLTMQNNWLEKFDGANGMGAICSHNGTLSALFFKLYHEFRQPDADSPLVIEALASEMLVEVSRGKKCGFRKPPPWLVRAREFVEAHFWEQLNLVMIAEEVGVHPVHLAREFRRYFDCTFGGYIRNRRIEYARERLAGSDDALAEIAQASGFCDQSHLSRTFKKATGTTPATFRRALMIDPNGGGHIGKAEL
jgi:AraC family transcriptional regulator